MWKMHHSRTSEPRNLHRCLVCGRHIEDASHVAHTAEKSKNVRQYIHFMHFHTMHLTPNKTTMTQSKRCKGQHTHVRRTVVKVPGKAAKLIQSVLWSWGHSRMHLPNI